MVVFTPDHKGQGTLQHNSRREKIFARNTSVSLITKSQAKIFLNLNHLQGFVTGSNYVALQNKDNTIVAVMVVKKTTNGVLQLLRYATSHNVVGGFTKLLKYVDFTYDFKKIVTFSDNTVSDGGLYANNGFKAVKELAPDYMYVVNGERKHKFGYRVKRFRNDPELQYVEGYTESQLAQLNGLPRIWDAGKTKWVKENTARMR